MKDENKGHFDNYEFYVNVPCALEMVCQRVGCEKLPGFSALLPRPPIPLFLNWTSNFSFSRENRSHRVKLG